MIERTLTILRIFGRILLMIVAVGIADSLNKYTNGLTIGVDYPLWIAILSFVYYILTFVIVCKMLYDIVGILAE